MATKKAVEKMISVFSSMWNKPEMIRGEIVDVYNAALAGLSDKELGAAVTAYLEDGQYFPKPADLRAKVSKLATRKHAQDLKSRFTCTKCGSQVSLIMGQGERGLCLDCSRGVIHEKEDIKRAIYPDQESVMIQDRTMCNSCKEVLTCYRDSIQDSWKCVDCYSGLTATQRVNRFQDLIRMMEDKTFKPEWADKIPF